MCFGTVDSWLIARLVGMGKHLTDLTNASRTGLLNLEALAWDSELFELFGIPSKAMPELRSSAGHFGACSMFRTSAKYLYSQFSGILMLPCSDMDILRRDR